MTIHNGSFSVSRYKVIGDNKKFTYQELNKKIKAFQAQPLRLKNIYKELMFGWVRPTGLDSVEFKDGDSWDMADIRLDDGFFFRIRIEKEKYLSNFFKLFLLKRSNLYPKKERVNL